MNFWSDIRNAMRQLLSRPLYTALSIGVLAGGLGCTLFMLSAINSMILQPLPFRDAQQLHHVGYVTSDEPDELNGVPQRDFVALRREQKAFAELAGYTQGTINVADANGPLRYDGVFMTGNLFQMLGVQPALGRNMTDADDVAGAPMVALIGDAAWRDRFGSDPAVVGKSVRVNGRDATVIGVMPPGFGFPYREQVWVPIRHAERTTPETELGVDVMGRLAPGISLEQASLALEALHERIDAERPASERRADRLEVEPSAYRFTSRESRRIVGMMFLTSLFVLLVACANVANLQLSQLAARRRELAVRAALGASRRRLMTLVMTESLVVSLVAAVIGLVLAHFAGRWILDMLIADEDAPAYWINFQIDGRMALLMVAAAALTTLVAGVVPALRAGGTTLQEAMRDGDKGGVGGGFARLSRGLVVGEIALSFVLLVGAGVSVRLLQLMLDTNLGTSTDAAQVATGRVALFPEAYPEPAQWNAFFERVTETLRAEPGVVDVTAATTLPGFMAGGADIEVQGADVPANGQLPESYYGAVDDHFFNTYGVKLRAGRFFDERDAAAAETPSVIIDEMAAEQLFAGRDPLGQLVRANPSDPRSRWGRIVGVVQKMHLEDVDDDRKPAMLVSLRQNPERYVTIAAHVQGDAAAFAPRIAEAVRSVDADTPSYWLRTQQRAVEMGRSGPELMARIFGTFGVLGLVLAAAGLYGVLAFSVEQRTREIGLRRAIGASESGVLRAVVGRSAWQVAIGLAIGIALGIPWANMMASQFTEVDANSAFLFPLVGVVIALVALVAALVPARRALRVDPMIALRYE